MNVNVISRERFAQSFDYCDILTRNAVNVSKVYRLASKLLFEKMEGGLVNPPIIVLTSKEGKITPIAVAKAERGNTDLAITRLKALQSMKSRGFIHLPEIFNNIDGEPITKIEGLPIYFIKYIQADSTPLSFEGILTAVGKFHHSAKVEKDRFQLSYSKFDEYRSRSKCFLDPWFQDNYPLFGDSAWREIIELSQYFSSEDFRQIYEKLPIQPIHGDYNQTNIMVSKKIPYFIDFDSFKLDVRLLDLASYFRYGGFDRYLELTKNQTLLDCIDSTYGKEADKLSYYERSHLHLMVAFSHIEFVSWALQELKATQMHGDEKKEKEFLQYLKGYKMQISQIINFLNLTP